MAAMASLSELVSTGSLRPMGVAATVERAPAGADDTLDVFYLTEVGERASEQALRWASRGGALPAEGDDVLLFLDSLGDPWALAWPSGSTPDVSASLASLAAADAALDARVDALEATRTVRGIIDTTGPSIVAGSGFSLAKNGVGDVTITFGPAFSTVPAVVATPMSGTQRVIAQLVAAATTSTVRVQVTKFDNTTLLDGQFHFTATST